MGIGALEYARLNAHRESGSYYTSYKKMNWNTDMSGAASALFPNSSSLPFVDPSTAGATADDALLSMAYDAYQNAGGLATKGRTDQSEELKNKIVNQYSEKIINKLGYTYLNNGFTALAIDVFKRNVQAHPTSWNTYDSLAEAYLRENNKSLAVVNYKLALINAPDDKTRQVIQKHLDLANRYK